MHNYTLNTEQAKQADSLSSRISETGKYVGVFTRAEAVTSIKGTTGIEFSFKSDLGATADYLTVWTHNAQGKELFGLKQINAIMTCLRLRQIAPKQMEIEKYDSSTKKMQKMLANVFPDLMGKPIGLLLQKDYYVKQDGSVGEKMNLFAAFEAATDFTASEILDKATTPERLERMVAVLRDRPHPHANQAPMTAPAPQMDDMSDDIPW